MIGVDKTFKAILVGIAVAFVGMSLLIEPVGIAIMYLMVGLSFGVLGVLFHTVDKNKKENKS